MVAGPIIPPMLGIALMLTAIICSRIINERAMRKLSADGKGKLVDAFSSLRVIALIPMAGLAGFYFAAESLGVSDTRQAMLWMCGFMLMFGAGVQFVVWRRLRSLGFSIDYVRQYVLGRLMVFAGALIMLASLAGQ